MKSSLLSCYAALLLYACSDNQQRLQLEQFSQAIDIDLTEQESITKFARVPDLEAIALPDQIQTLDKI